MAGSPAPAASHRTPRTPEPSFCACYGTLRLPVPRGATQVAVAQAQGIPFGPVKSSGVHVPWGTEALSDGEMPWI